MPFGSRSAFARSRSFQLAVVSEEPAQFVLFLFVWVAARLGILLLGKILIRGPNKSSGDERRALLDRQAAKTQLVPDQDGADGEQRSIRSAG
jgi:hypothetical protein